MFFVFCGLLFPSICIHLHTFAMAFSLQLWSTFLFAQKLHWNNPQWEIYRRYLFALNKSFWVWFYCAHWFKAGSYSCFIHFPSDSQKEVLRSFRRFLLFKSSNWMTEGVLHCLYTTVSRSVSFGHVALNPAVSLLGQGNSMVRNCKIANQFHSWGSSLNFTGVLVVWISALLLFKPRRTFYIFSNKKSAWNGLSSS